MIWDTDKHSIRSQKVKMECKVQWIAVVMSFMEMDPLLPV
jgi:hypothetical protein